MLDNQVTWGLFLTLILLLYLLLPRLETLVLNIISISIITLFSFSHSIDTE